MKSIIHVNKHHIASNTKDGGNRPVYTIKSGGKTKYAREVVIKGPSRLVYNGKRLSCGARAWIETSSELELIDEMTFEESKTKIKTDGIDMLHQTCPFCMLGDLREESLQDSWQGLLTCSNCDQTMDRFATLEKV